MSEQGCKNTDREIWRGPDEGGGDFYADSLHITEGRALGINCGGHVIVKPIREWHRLAASPPAHQENSPRSAPESAPAQRASHKSGERLPSSDAADAGADTEPAPQVREALEDLLVVVSTEAKRTAGFLSKATWQPRRESIEGQVKLLDYIADKLLAALTPVVAREPVQANTEQVHGKGDQLSMERAAVSDAMIDAALNAWFKSPPSESDMGLERSMGAALEAASLIANQNDLRGSQPETRRALSIKGADLKQADETSKQKLTDPSC